MSAADSICEDQVCYGDSFILIDVATGKSVNNGVSNRSGYLGLCDPNKSGEISIVMRRRDKHGRDGDPICYGDTNVVLEVIESKDEKRFIGEISNFKKMIKKSYSEVNTCINFTLTAADYYWARLIVSSRNFGILVNGKKVNALVPYADMLNHDFNPNTRWSFNNTSNCFEMISTSDIKKDDILTDTYGKSKSAETFLLYYGFYPESNRRNVEKIDNYTSTLDEDTTRFHQTFNKQEKLALGYLIDQKRRDVLGNRYVLQPGN